MSFFTNLFSGNSYTKMGSTLTNNDTGHTFQRLGSNYVSDDGHIISKLGDQWVNQETSVSSAFGDPFANRDDWGQ
jgi:hypothetical protein